MATDKPKIGLVGDSGRGTLEMLAFLEGKTLDDFPPVEIRHPITAPAHKAGPFGKAWPADLAETRHRMRKTGRVDALRIENDPTVCHWIVEAPWAHPAWHSYSLFCTSLVAAPGYPDPVFYLPDATHELWVWAIDPGADRNMMLLDVEHHQRNWLRPMNFGAQFIEVTDDLARARVENSVQLIIDGKLSPDTDHQKHWEYLWGSNMIKRGRDRGPIKSRRY